MIELFEKVRKDLDERKKENEELRNLLNAENSKRQKESEDIKRNLSDERKELKDYIESENLGELAVASDNSNDVVLLFRSLKEENERRKGENDLLRKLLEEERSELSGALGKKDSELRELRELMARGQSQLKSQLESQSASLSQQVEEEGAEVRKLRDGLVEVRGRLERPVAYFAAVREEPYCTGGEEYLTFSHCPVNRGGDMDPKSGIFTASVPGRNIVDHEDLMTLSNIYLGCVFRLLHVLHHSLHAGYEEGPDVHQEERRGDWDSLRPEPH